MPLPVAGITNQGQGLYQQENRLCALIRAVNKGPFASDLIAQRLRELWGKLRGTSGRPAKKMTSYR
jgi:hypothetical protein